MLKRICLFILFLLLWFLGYFIPIDYSYYKELMLPGFAPPSWFYGVIWTINYILLSISMSSIFSEYKYKDIPKEYKISLVINYLFNQSFIIVFFLLKSNFLGFVSCIGTFISSLFLYEESLELNKKSTQGLKLYVLFNIYASILSLSIYLLNL
ncbi:MAG: TspO/MBR family protein [Bacilli bacterium]|nr:TspO/MBR family protein [Bacilli bacterium]